MKKERAMRITGVTNEQYRRYIPLKGWKSVEKAIQIYDDGFIRGSRATENEQVRAIAEENGDFASVFYLDASLKIGKRNKIVENMLQEAKSALKTRDNWKKDYDYDGMGTAFFKTSVEIKILDRESDLYAISIYASYVGDKPEEELAEYFGIPRALIWSIITVQTEPVGTDCFAFDFEWIARKLDSTLDIAGIGGETIAQAMIEKVENESKAEFVLLTIDDFTVTIGPARVEDRFIWKDPQGPGRKKIDTWSIDGAVLSGLLDSSYEDRQKKEPPSFSISIAMRRKTDWGIKNVPVWDMKKQERIIMLTDTIVKAFS